MQYTLRRKKDLIQFKRFFLNNQLRSLTYEMANKQINY